MTRPIANDAWAGVATTLAGLPVGARLIVPKRVVPPPSQAGATWSLGLWRGQTADWRWTLPDCRGLHAQDFGSSWQVHLDQVSPSCDLAEHVRRDVPRIYLAAGAITVVSLVATAVLLLTHARTP